MLMKLFRCTPLMTICSSMTHNQD